MSSSLILASGSPRRRQLLEQLGLTFSIDPPDVDETLLNSESPDIYVKRLSLDKACTVFERSQAGAANQTLVVLAADTTVDVDGTVLGKPGSKQEGIEMLMALSGSTHRVLTGVTVLAGHLVEQKPNQIDTFCLVSEVRFRQLHPDEMAFYWETGEPRDKAGGYGLQGLGAAFVESISGSYTNVIGLPVSETVLALRRAGIACLGVTDKNI